eukprot:TRINITY_DN69_c0_g1_i19.p1 TRINITY_DN69_c0_g1~~TRINITY_DN69_c0_g1_i19.p1  ORF type:complete len:635 (+),score=69.94 TRINITY_DN69_c0_g1_i19:277-2181(+)
MTEELKKLMASLSPEYSTWSKVQVKVFLDGMRKMHQMDEKEDLSRFEKLTGAGLKQLTLEGYKERNADYGEILFNTLKNPQNSGNNSEEKDILLSQQRTLEMAQIQIEKLKQENAQYEMFFMTSNKSEEVYTQLTTEEKISQNDTKFKSFIPNKQYLTSNKIVIDRIITKLNKISRSGLKEKKVQDTFEEIFGWKSVEKPNLEVYDTHSKGLLNPVAKPDFCLGQKTKRHVSRVLWSMICSVIELKKDITDVKKVVGQIIERHFQILHWQQKGRDKIFGMGLSLDSIVFVLTQRDASKKYVHYHSTVQSLDKVGIAMMLLFLASNPDEGLGFKSIDSARDLPKLKKVKRSGEATLVKNSNGGCSVWQFEDTNGKEYYAKKGQVTSEVRMIEYLNNEKVSGIPTITETKEDCFVCESYGDLIEAFGNNPQEAFEVISSAAGILQQVHKKGFVHGDIKPSNIVYDESVTIIDWGSARAFGLCESLSNTPSYRPLRWPSDASSKQTIMFRDDWESLFYTLLSVLYSSSKPLLPFKPNQDQTSRISSMKNVDMIVKTLNERRLKKKSLSPLTPEQTQQIKMMHNTLFYQEGKFSYTHEVQSLDIMVGNRVAVVSPCKTLLRKIGATPTGLQDSPTSFK